MCVFTCAFWSLGSGHEQRWRLPHLRHKHAPQTDISLGTQEVLNGKRNQKSKKRRKVEKKWIFIPPPFILVPVFFPSGHPSTSVPFDHWEERILFFLFLSLSLLPTLTTRQKNVVPILFREHSLSLWVISSSTDFYSGFAWVLCHSWSILKEVLNLQLLDLYWILKKTFSRHQVSLYGLSYSVVQRNVSRTRSINPKEKLHKKRRGGKKKEVCRLFLTFCFWK